MSGSDLMDAAEPVGPSPIDDVEAQMRRALSALGPRGGMRAPRPNADRTESPGTMRMGDRLGAAHRRRFVQDGDVQVAYVRREPAREAAATAAVQPQAPSALSVRLQRVEAELATQTAARQQAERAAQDAQAMLRDLRTKLGHVDLARIEAVEALRKEREQQAARRAAELEAATREQDAEEKLRAAQRALSAAQAELAEERGQRRALEKELKAAQDAREAAERLVRVLSEDQDEPERVTPTPARRPGRAPARVAEVTEDAEPVKWWLSTPAAKRR